MEVIFVILVSASKNLWRQKRGVERTKNIKEHRVLKVPGGLSFVYSLVRSVSKLSCFEFRLKTRNFSRLKLSSRKTFEKPLKKRDVKKRFFIFFLLRFLLFVFFFDSLASKGSSRRRSRRRWSTATPYTKTTGNPTFKRQAKHQPK